MATAALPEWRAPKALGAQVQQRLPQLEIFNSLTRNKTPFVPRDPEGRAVDWYACGPTVYDDAHLGHARNYVSTDIIRRILTDYFKFRVNFVMNITDVDDKIILAARQQYLLSRWLANHLTVDQGVRDVATEAFVGYVGKNLPLLGADVKPESYVQQANEVYGHVLQGQSIDKQGPPGDKEAKVKMHLKAADSAAEALRASTIEIGEFEAKASGVLLPHIDQLEKHTISGKDHDIFTKLTKQYEQRFFDDMGSLNVRYPDKVTRVTEYGPQIVDYVKQIQKNGFAYENEGSVYYDTTAWEESGGIYARLQPWNRNDKELQQDGEGSLSTKKAGFKRSGADFALWKASKEGEPSWASPWGEGRPGWHIECSAMASDVLGKQFDIHSGGIDLAFPHHDNELAQSEAYWAKSGKESEQWVNYFLHMGHLSIQGSKMSKSLKNFTTIREALAKGDWTPRGLRIVFLLGSWGGGLEITGDVVTAGKALQEKLDSFFIKVRDIQYRAASQEEHSNGVTNGISTLTVGEESNGTASTLDEALQDAKSKFHDALCESFDTPKAMRVISDLITAYNSEKNVPDTTSIHVAEWVTDMVVMFGLDPQYKAGQLGWSGVDIPDGAMHFVRPLSVLRDRVRQEANKTPLNAAAITEILSSEPAIETPSDASSKLYAKAYADFRQNLDSLATSPDKKALFDECDRVRNITLWDLGIYLEDREKLPALIRPVSASVRAEREEQAKGAEAKAAKEAAKTKAKEEAKVKAEEQAAAKLEKGKLSHLEMFRTSEYTEWDDAGFPLKDAKGEELTKSRGKVLKKEYERQKKAHEAWLAAAK